MKKEKENVSSPVTHSLLIENLSGNIYFPPREVHFIKLVRDKETILFYLVLFKRSLNILLKSFSL